jgi:hypothetical protein
MAAGAAVDYAKHSSRSHDAVLLKTPRLRSEESLANPILRICLFRHAQFARRIRNTNGRDLPGRTCEAQGSGVLPVILFPNSSSTRKSPRMKPGAGNVIETHKRKGGFKEC